MYDRFFSPRSVVVIGASGNPTKLGFGVARNLIESNYQGDICFVNPNRREILGQKTYPKIEDIPDFVDLALIVIPASRVPGALELCGKRGIPFAIIISGGFSEVGEKGEALEGRCLEIAAKYSMRILGPNCIGIIDTILPIDTTFLPLPGPNPGEIAFLSHSGATCAAVIDWVKNKGLGFSKLISLGNQMDITETDLLLPVAADDDTRVITMYMESVGDGAKYIEVTKSITKLKPIIAIKVGRTEKTREAIVSHTGALAGQDIAFEAAFNKAGVMRAHTIEEMFDWARALAWSPLPQSNRVVVLTNAGGMGVIAMDAIQDEGLIPADLAADTLAELGDLLPPEANLKNPVDMLASAGPSEYELTLSILLKDEGVDGIIVILPPPPILSAQTYADAIMPVVKTASKPILLSLIGDELLREASESFHRARIPSFGFPEQAISAMGALVKRAELLSSPTSVPEEFHDVDSKKVAELLRKSRIGADGFMAASSASQILSAYGVQIPREMVAMSKAEAIELAEKLGFPVTLKINSVDLPHKSELGGVHIDLQDSDHISEAFTKIIRECKDHLPGVEGIQVLVQEMVYGGQEVVVGVVRDMHFGPLVMFGSGGMEVEVLNDTAFALAPLCRSEVGEMLEKTWAGRKLQGFRNIEAADRDAVIETVLRVGQLAEDFPQIEELEINPLIVLPQGNGAIAVDVRMKVVKE